MCRSGSLAISTQQYPTRRTRQFGTSRLRMTPRRSLSIAAQRLKHIPRSKFSLPYYCLQAMPGCLEHHRQTFPVGGEILEPAELGKSWLEQLVPVVMFEID